MRAALYARFSTDMQNPASIEDQMRLCRELAESLGATVVAELEDAGISGTSMANRPGVQALMDLARRRAVDIVIAEHTDRLARSGTDGWGIYEDLEALGVQYVTVNQGTVTEVEQGVSSLVSALKIKEVRHRTRRGLAGVVRGGRAAGGRPYGYDIVLSYDAKGDRIPGLRRISETERPIILRIFTDYANGASPLAIASALNNEGVPGPTGGKWNASSLQGDAKAGRGILRNEIYRGIRVWGANTMVKDRRTGKRRTLSGKPAGEVVRSAVPELRIVDDTLWARVQARLTAQAIGPAGENRGVRRPKTLLGGLIRCGECGGVMTRGGSGDHLRCAIRASQGPGSCSNTRTPSYGDIESRVLASVQANLLHPDVVAAAVAEYQAAMAGERRAALQHQAAAARELAEVKRRLARLIAEVEEGMPWKAVADRHAELTDRQALIEAQISAAAGDANLVQIYPGAAGMFRKMIQDLHDALDHAGDRTSAESREGIRGLVSAVRYFPREKKGQYQLEIAANLAPILQLGDGQPLVEALNSGS